MWDGTRGIENMKVRFDFVTNSSSTSFGAALSSGVLGGMITFLGMSCQCSSPDGDDDDTDRGGGGADDRSTAANAAAIDAALQASQQAAQEAADKLAADAAARDSLVGGILSAEDKRLADTANKFQKEIDAYNQQWQDAQKGADPNDPGYADMKKRYEDYTDYIKSQLDEVKAQQYRIEVARVQEQIAKDSRSSWIKQQQEDLVQVKEQKSFLEAVSKGYGKNKDYDISRIKTQLDQLNQREVSISGTLKANNAEIDYIPRNRGEIGPDPEMARINSEYKEKMRKLQDEIDTRKGQEFEAKRRQLEKDQARLEQDMVNQGAKASFWNVMTKAAETTQVVSDIGVDVLSNLTGPAGKTIKTLYTGIKGVAGGVGEGLANNQDNIRDLLTKNLSAEQKAKIYAEMQKGMSKEVAKGALGGLSDVIKDKVGDKLGKAAQNIYGIGSEAGKSMFESGLDGKTSTADMIKAGLSGAAKGSLDAAGNVIADGILPGGKDMPTGLDWQDVNVGNFINSVKSNNPLTVRNIGRDAIGNSLQGFGVDQAKNFIKGDNVIYSGVNQGLTGKVIDTGTSLGAPKYTPYVSSGIDKAGQAFKATGQAMSNLASSFTGAGQNVVY